MTVKQLIENLSKFDENLIVLTDNGVELCEVEAVYDYNHREGYFYEKCIREYCNTSGKMMPMPENAIIID